MLAPTPNVHKSVRKCKPDKTPLSLFLGLFYYHCKLFTESSLNEIVRFYDVFDNRGLLVRWMKVKLKGRRTSTRPVVNITLSSCRHITEVLNEKEI